MNELQDFPLDPVYAFAPAYDLPDRPQQIRIVFVGMTGYIPTAMSAIDLDNAEELCDRMNRALGHDREAWTAIVAQALSSNTDRKSMN
ncbi:MAG: hypothetical protein OYH76_11770 [Defluviicoccus sp.]|nr:hypothetical protein [Defluviicoccus sp.]MDE0276564.1 hypothetical protein [Defluviicoccus sp.]